uniref:Uncharacterized protein n=1 Tax=Timema monikensis TaxID=170555 RepID=A0A7R9HPK9_9NEOP|nr:unnamed protein product [Timema monikensis]
MPSSVHPAGIEPRVPQLQQSSLLTISGSVETWAEAQTTQIYMNPHMMQGRLQDEMQTRFGFEYHHNLYERVLLEGLGFNLQHLYFVAPCSWYSKVPDKPYQHEISVDLIRHRPIFMEVTHTCSNMLALVDLLKILSRVPPSGGPQAMPFMQDGLPNLKAECVAHYAVDSVYLDN